MFRLLDYHTRVKGLWIQWKKKELEFFVPFNKISTYINWGHTKPYTMN